MTAVNTDPDRPRAQVVIRDGAVTWTCPYTDCHPVKAPVATDRLPWAIYRARLHMRQRHAYIALAGWRPTKPRPALAAAPSAREATVITFTGPGRPRGHVVPPLAG